jgi:RNA polymerase sigma-70 factor (ECF subfamily)
MELATTRREERLRPEPVTERELAASSSETADVYLAAAGDRLAFERLYRLHVARIHSLVRRMVGGEDDPDRLTQDVFVRAWQKLGTYRGEAAFGTWLHRLAVNVVLGWRKGAARERLRWADADEAAAPSRPRDLDLALDLEAAIAKLPPGARTVFVLHDVEGMRHQEIAERMGVVTGTTKAQLHRARMLLRELLTR